MAKKNVIGTCALCKKKKSLRKSHYLGRALYNLSRGTKGEDPVVMTPELVTLSPRQMWAHLLCADCEELFNKKGETPTTKLINRNTSFPLLDKMELALAIKKDKGSITYSGLRMGVDMDALAYFALSVLWRGGARKWRTLGKQTTSVDLGKFEEPIRRYLLGETGIPNGVYVLVGICTDVGSQGQIFPPVLSLGPKYRMYSILVRGIWFHIITDDNPPPGIENLCSVRSTLRVLHLEDCHQKLLHAARHLIKNAKVDERLQ